MPRPNPAPNPFGAAPSAPNPFGATAPSPPAQPSGSGFAPVAAPAAAGPKFHAVCPQCSSPNAGSKRFCLTCGFDLSVPAGAAAAPAAPPVVAPVPQPMMTPPPAVSQPVAQPIAQPAPVFAPPPVAQPVASRARLVLISPDGTEGGTFQLAEGATRVGRNTDPLFQSDPYMSPQHATFTVQGNSVTVKDEGSLNGVYLRVAKQVPVEIKHNDVFRIGQEILRFERYSGIVLEADGTERQGAQIEGLVGKISLLVGRETTGNAFPIPVTGLFMGRERGDILFPEDGYVSGLHGQLIWDQATSTLTLTDLNSSNGTYIRLRAPHALQNGDLLLMGQQLFRLGIG